jgi:ferredoxin
MNTIIITALLLFMVLVGWQMSRGVTERFHDVVTGTVIPASGVHPVLTIAVAPKSTNVDTLKRDQIAVAAATSCSNCAGCPKCTNGCPNGVPKGCPDMSKYIKKDEIPCWNCSLS